MTDNSRIADGTSSATSGPQVGVQGLGCMGMSFAYGPTDEAAARATLERALELGRHALRHRGRLRRGREREVPRPVLRGAPRRGHARHQVRHRARPGRPAPGASSATTRAYIRQAVEDSLRRLGVDVDRPLLHAPPRRGRAASRRRSARWPSWCGEGKVKHLGLSEVTGAELREAHAVHPIAAVQSEWSLFSRDIETSVVPAAARARRGPRAVLAARPRLPDRARSPTPTRS